MFDGDRRPGSRRSLPHGDCQSARAAGATAAVSDRSLVLLRRAGSASSSDDDVTRRSCCSRRRRVSDSLVRRGGGGAGVRLRLRQRSLRPARRSLVGRRHPGAVPRCGGDRSTRCTGRWSDAAAGRYPRRRRSAGRARRARGGGVRPARQPPAAARRQPQQAEQRALAFADAGLPCRRSGRWTSTRTRCAPPQGLPYPLVVKPLALSGSRGVMRVDDATQFAAGGGTLLGTCSLARRSRRARPAHAHVLRRSRSSRARVSRSKVCSLPAPSVPLAIFDKPDPLDGPFFEETIYVTPSRAPRASSSAMREAVAARHGRSASRTVRCTPSAACNGGRRLRARSGGTSDWRALRAGRCALPAAAGGDVSLEEVLLRHASARTSPLRARATRRRA